jgi:hypothetical protein
VGRNFFRPHPDTSRCAGVGGSFTSCKHRGRMRASQTEPRAECSRAAEFLSLLMVFSGRVSRAWIASPGFRRRGGAHVVGIILRTCMCTWQDNHAHVLLNFFWGGSGPWSPLSLTPSCVRVWFNCPVPCEKSSSGGGGCHCARGRWSCSRDVICRNECLKKRRGVHAHGNGLCYRRVGTMMPRSVRLTVIEDGEEGRGEQEKRNSPGDLCKFGQISRQTSTGIA